MERFKFTRLSRWNNSLEKVAVLETQEAFQALMGVAVAIITTAKAFGFRTIRD